MRILIKTGYNEGLLLAEGRGEGILTALTDATKVRMEGYGDNLRYVPQDGGDIEISIVNSASVALPDAPDASTWVKAYTEECKKTQELNLKVWKLEAELKKLTPANLGANLGAKSEDNIPF